MSSLSGHASSPGGKKSKRALGDEALRKRIEHELSRKRTISTTHQSGRRRGGKPNVAKGTVAALKPSPALTVPDTITVAEASQLCAAKRTDCVLVVDDDEGLSGIFTAKDLAYRVTAEGIDPHTTTVSQVMTRGPMVTRDTTSATEALQLMVERHFRHLPVCNEDGNVVGLLDITKVFHEALDKVERGSSASEKLYSALAGVQSELGAGLGANPQTAAMLSYVEALREKTALPDLTTVMDSRTQPAVVGPRATVREVARLMRERRTTAVCVMEPTATPGAPPKIAGIFTSKDVVLRVIAAGLDASVCSVIRVMTPHPDTAPPTMTIHDALKKMHNGHYLNLPVVEEDGRLVAIVDVLKLTYATLEQMNHLTAEAAGETTQEVEGGPMWGRFFDSIGGHDDADSAYSGSHPPMEPHNSSFSLSQLQPSAQSEVHPNDSASVADDASALGYAGRAGNVPSILAPAIPVDDGTYVFKFRTPSGNTHRFQARKDNVENLRDIVSGKLTADSFFTEFKPTNAEDPIPDPLDFQLAYTDADGDTVLMTSDTDVADAVKIARNAGVDRVVLTVQGGRGWAEAGAGRSEAKAKAAAAAAQNELKEVEKSEGGHPEVDACNAAKSMATADRDDALNTLASRLFAAMLDDIVVDVALQSHQEVARSRRKCDICHTHCGQAHTPIPSGSSLAGLTAASQQSTLTGSSPRPGTPPRDAGTPARGGTPTPTPNGSVNKDGTVFLDCVGGCGRLTASNRYASHLSVCIGIGTGTRRAAARNATSKSRLGSDAGRSASPYPASENGNASDHNNAPPPPQPGPKKKGRPPKNKAKAPVPVASTTVADGGDALTNRKRPGSPLSSPTKNAKKQKLSATPLARGGSNTPLGPPGTKSKIPSRLRESSIASFLEPDATGVSPGSRSSSPGTAATPTSSVLGGGRPNGASGGGFVEEKKMPLRAPSPPRPPPPITRRPETDYLVDVEGDETGSSTDTDTD